MYIIYNKMDEITNKLNKINIIEKNYIDELLIIINECYNFENNKNITSHGIKNNNFENEIELIIKKFCIKIKKKDTIINNKLCYKHQPNGSQLPPDFTLFYNTNKINIECKSSKNLKPIWNCSIPNEYTIYLFYTTKLNKTFIFTGNEIIDKNKIKEIKEFNEMIKKISKEFNENILNDEYFQYYPRQMINQHKNFNIENRNKYLVNVINKIKNLI